MQINRADVYANNSCTESFFERHNDYCGGCGYVDIDCGSAGEDTFPESGFPQRLSIYDGLLTIQGNGFATRMFGWPSQDVIAIAADDTREAPQPIQVALRMLRYKTTYFGGQLETFALDHVNTIQNRSHTAASQLHVRGDRILLSQDFREGEYCCKSAVAVGVVGRAVKPAFSNETEVRLTAAAGRGSFTILIATAASFDRSDDVAAAALRQMEEAVSKGFTAMAADTRDWWHDFWSRGFVHLHSADGEADFVEQNNLFPVPDGLQFARQVPAWP